LQYRWLSTDRWLDLDLGLVEACGSRHDVELVLIQAEQGYWAGDLDSYGRSPSWLRRLQAGVRGSTAPYADYRHRCAHKLS
jgi:hypothetical protein